MNAVLRVDHELLAARVLLAVRVLLGHVLVHGRRAHAAERPVVGADVALHMALVVAALHDEVHGLVLGMVRARARHRGEDVKRQLAVRLGVLDRLAQRRRFRVLVVGLGVVEGPRRAALEDHRVDARVEQAAPEAERVEARADVAHLVQLGDDPALVELLLVRLEVDRRVEVVLAALRKRVHGGLGGDHAALHRVVRALDLGHVEEARRAADQRATGEVQLGDRLVAALVQRTRTVREALAALEHLGEEGVVLHPLELLEGA